VASNKKVPVLIELNLGMIIEIKIDSNSWTNRYWPSGTWVKNERKIFGCNTSEMLEFRIFAKVRTIKVILENIQIKLEIAASFLNSKFV
jgi:metal-sulfur cluster biosynthetic enzyme